MLVTANTLILVSDNNGAAKDVLAALNGLFAVRQMSLDAYLAQDVPKARVAIFCLNLGAPATFNRLKKKLKGNDVEHLFVLPTLNSDVVSQLRQYSDGDYLVLPVGGKALRTAVKHALNRQVERSWEALEPKKRMALKETLVCFENCFERVQSGQPLPMESIQSSCRHIRDAAALGGLDSWIDALDNHHSYTFRHSMFVCGTLAYYAASIGIRGDDLDKITIGGLLHDIGKCRVALEILDKPGKLDDAEWQAMKLHPMHSRDILRDENDVDPDLHEMAVFHHEKLDGTGYPDGLSGSKISDLVRLTAISDIYSALIDKRAYKGAMTSQGALDAMATMKDHLDMDLFRSFREFVLDGG